jgi:amino acid transporter
MLVFTLLNMLGAKMLSDSNTVLVIWKILVPPVVYILLEVAFIGALNPANLIHGWANPIGHGDYGPYYTLALGAGVGWLATILIIDAFISPTACGMVYLGTSSRLSYALGQSDALEQAGRCHHRPCSRPAPVIGFSLAIFYYAVEFRMSDQNVQAALASDTWQLPDADEVAS